MNILYISNHFSFSHQPGAPRPIKVTQFLASQGYNVTVITNRNHYLDDRYCLESGIYSVNSNFHYQLLSVATPAGRRRNLLLRLINYLAFSVQSFKRALALPKQDIIIVGTPPLLVPVVGLVLKWCTESKIILEVRDLYPETAVSLGKLKNRLIELLWRKWENLLRRRYDHVVAVVPGIKNELVAQGIDEGKITIITNGYDGENADVTLPPEINTFFYQHQKHLKIIYGGGMGYGIDLLPVLQAARSLRNSTDIVFAFFGQGEKRKEYIKYANQENLSNVFFFHPQPRRVIKKVYQKADILIHSFIDDVFFRHAFPNKIFDYHGAGTAIVFAGDGETAELIRQAGSGIVVEPENHDAIVQAISFLYEYPSKRIEMGKRGQQYIKKYFSRERIFQLWNEVLYKLKE